MKISNDIMAEKTRYIFALICAIMYVFSGTCGVVPAITESNTRWTPYTGDIFYVSTTPCAEFSISGDLIMVCSNQVALCKLHNCASCDHHGDEEHCPFAYQESSQDLSPTFGKALEVYSSSNKKTRHRDSVVSCITKDIKTVGLTLDSRCVEMTRTKFKTLISILQKPMHDGSVLRGETIKTHLSAFRSISSEDIEEKYNEMGFDLPQFSIPKFVSERVKVQEISDRTIRLVEIEMEKWLASGRPSDADAYKMCFFALYCGMRAGDICEAKWDIIKHTTQGVMISYVPHKTSLKCGKVVSFIIDNKTYCKIEPLIGNPDEYVITRHPDRTPCNLKTHGMYTGIHRYLRFKVNKMLSMCGIGNEFRSQKKTHALRKYFETDRAMKYGRHEAAMSCGHSISVQDRYYLGSMIGKVS